MQRSRCTQVCSRNIIDHNICNFLQPAFVIPKLLKEFEKIVGILIAFGFLYRIISVIAAFAAEIDSGKAADRHIGALIDCHKTHHLFLRDIRFENNFAPDPVCAFFSDCFLR